MNPTMNSQQIQDFIATWAKDKGFNAPYGVLTSEGKSPKGRKVLNVTFGRARTLDATVVIFNRKYIIVRTSRQIGGQIFTNVGDLQTYLNTL